MNIIIRKKDSYEEQNRIYYCYIRFIDELSICNAQQK